MKRISVENLSLNDAFDEFITLKKAYGKSRATIVDYEDTYQRFCTLMGVDASTDVIVLSENYFAKWLTKLQDTGIKPTSINHYLRGMRTFVNYCIEKEYIAPFKIKELRVQQETIKFFTDQEIVALLKKPPRDCSFTEYRTWVIINLVMATGIRADTIVNLRISDVDLDNDEIVLAHLKNKKVQTLPISASLKQILREYLRTFQRDTDNDWLFCSAEEEQLSTSAIRQTQNRYCERRGVSPKGPHALRHTFARSMVKNGCNSFILQRFLTHSSIQMSQHYVNLFSEDLKDSAMQYIPLDNFKK